MSNNSINTAINPNYGCLYGIGVGPGDPELVTLKAQRILKDVPIICTPQSDTSRDSFALSIARQFIDTERQELLHFGFPTDDAEAASRVWETAAETLAGRLKEGQDVAFITEGDPMLFSTFSYVLESIRANHPDIAVEIIPGGFVGDGGGGAGQPPPGNPRATAGDFAGGVRH